MTFAPSLTIPVLCATCTISCLLLLSKQMSINQTWYGYVSMSRLRLYFINYTLPNTRRLCLACGSVPLSLVPNTGAHTCLDVESVLHCIFSHTKVTLAPIAANSWPGNTLHYSNAFLKLREYAA